MNYISANKDGIIAASNSNGDIHFKESKSKGIWQKMAGR
jgi:hypothetical protein